MANVEPDDSSFRPVVDDPTRASAPPAEHPAGVHESSVWPSVLAGGLTVAFFGLIAWTWPIVALGVVGTIVGIAGWVGELLRGPAHELEPEVVEAQVSPLAGSESGHGR